MSANTEVMTINSTDDGKEDACNVLPSKFAVHVRHDKRKKFFTRATSAKITIKEFFDFIKTAYQVNESLDQLVPDLLNDDPVHGDGGGNTTTTTAGGVNWNKLANNQLITQLIMEEQRHQMPNDKMDSTTMVDQSTRKESESQTISTAEDATTLLTSGGGARLKSTNQSPTTTSNNDGNEAAKQTSITVIHDMMDETISEGILDKVLPYLTPSNLTTSSNATQPIIKKHAGGGAPGASMAVNNAGDHRKSNKHGGKDPHHSAGPPHKTHSTGHLAKGSVASSSASKLAAHTDPTAHKNAKNADNDLQLAKSSSTSVTTAEPEVEIHVCDEVKHLKKDFRCPQSLLVAKMGYFAEITAGQRLEDIDISVHCDICIFDWLMRWTKKDALPPEEWPQLESICVAPILVSAVFLQMDPLIDECLLYCHAHMNEVLKTSTNLSCLNDVIITRLAAMYTNTELELIKDKKDKIISRLYCKLILSLGEPVAQSIRGHWSTLAGIYKCSKCSKLIVNNDRIATEIQCVPSQMNVSLCGDIVNQHERDINWNLSEYIIKLYHELKTWRKVYWRLWSVCHYLRCMQCLTLFPMHQMSWCCQHTEQPQFFITEQHARTTTIPVGRYSCCGARTYRFEVLTNTSQGCQFKEHIPDVKNPRDLALLSIFNQHRGVIEQPPPEIMIPERLTKLVARDATSDCNKLFNNKEILWWEGIELAPTRQKLGLLGKMCFVGPHGGTGAASSGHRLSNSSYYNNNENDEYSSEYSSDDNDYQYDDDDSDSDSTLSQHQRTGGGTNDNVSVSLNEDKGGITSSTSDTDDEDADADNTDQLEQQQNNQQQQYRTELSLSIFNMKRRFNYEQKRKRRRRRKHRTRSVGGAPGGTGGGGSRSHHQHHQHHHQREAHGNVGRYWSPNLSARSNQDLQRDFEENAMQQITDFLSRRTAGVTNVMNNNNTNTSSTTTTTTMLGGDVLATSSSNHNNKASYYTASMLTSASASLNAQKQSINNKIQYANIWNHHITPTGGIYQRLEAEWNEINRQQQQMAASSYHQTSKHRNASSLSSSYIVKPKFRVHRNTNTTSSSIASSMNTTSSFITSNDK